MSSIPTESFKRDRNFKGQFLPIYEKLLTKKFLEKKYLSEELSLKQISEIVGCDKKTVLNYFKKFKINTRPSIYAQHLRLKRNFIITKEVKNYIDGLLLSDGYIAKKSKWSARFDQGFSFKFMNWAKKIKKDFLNYGIESNIIKAKTKGNIIKKTGQYLKPIQYVYLFTKFYEEFLIFKKRWYPNGKKQIPKNLEFSPQMMANWYMGDGYYDSNKGRSAFSVHCYDNDEVKFLSDNLNRILNIQPKIYPHRNQDNQLILKLSRKDSKIFLNYIKPYKVKCFDYKWGNIDE